MGLYVYLLGITDPETVSKVEMDYYLAQLQLVKHGFRVFNPMKFYLNSSLPLADVKERNLNELIKADAVYILKETDINPKCIEYKVAKALNKTFITGFLEL